MNKTILSVKAPTPSWATWAFRIVFILTGVAAFVIAADPAFSDALKVRTGIYLKGVDMVVWAITRAIGIEVQRDYNLPNQNP